MSAYEMVFGVKPKLATNYFVPEVNYSENPSEQMMDTHFRIQQSVRERKKAAFQRQAKYYNQRMHVKNFQPNDIVFYIHKHSGNMFRKFQIKWDGPAKIVRLEKDGNVTIEHLQTGRRFTLHCDRLKPGSAEDQIYRRPSQSNNPGNKDVDKDDFGDLLTEGQESQESQESPGKDVSSDLSQSRSLNVPIPHYTGPVTRSRAKLPRGQNTVLAVIENWQHKRWNPFKYKKNLAWTASPCSYY